MFDRSNLIRFDQWDKVEDRPGFKPCQQVGTRTERDIRRFN